jgi:hypothetical protein
MLLSVLGILLLLLLLLLRLLCLLRLLRLVGKHDGADVLSKCKAWDSKPGSLRVQLLLVPAPQLALCSMLQVGVLVCFYSCRCSCLAGCAAVQLPAAGPACAGR